MPPPVMMNRFADQNPKQTYGSDTASNNLWVGNIPTDVTESDLATLFGKFGEIDRITSYAARSYAFLYFKRTEDAIAAKNYLQGTVIHGHSIKIDFAKPAKPCKTLWMSGISPSVSKEKLEGEFLKFGKIEDFKFLRDRNAAFVDYFKIEDASQALKIMNGKSIGGEHSRVDFLRSQPSKREMPDLRDAKGLFIRSMAPPDAPWMQQDLIRNYSEPLHSGLNIQQHSQFLGGQVGDGPPSNVLFIVYPPSVLIDEQMLHNAMILFGEIERIRSFPTKNFSFVEFRSVDEARRAKEGLEGRLFNDPRISILYSSNELAPTKDHLEFYAGIKEPRMDMLLNEHPGRPSQVDLLSHIRPVLPNGIPGPILPSGILGPNMSNRNMGLQNGFEHLTSGPDVNDLAAVHNYPDNNLNNQTRDKHWRRFSNSVSGILPSPSPGMKPSTRPMSGAWDVFDASQIQRETKRSRIDGPLPYNPSRYTNNLDDRGMGLDQFHGLGPQVDKGASASFSATQGRNRLSPGDRRFTASGQPLLDHDYVWRGIIAKGGSPVCHARCVPVGEGIESDIPDVVNCSARTGLDMLTKHYADAIGFSIVFFLPDSEDDFASYTEFLRYLGAKKRAGVAKFDDGTTLFLVPPSEFLTKVLNVTGPERLYGVVLKFPQNAPSSTPVHSHSQLQSMEPQYFDRNAIPPQTEYRRTPQEEKFPQVDYNRTIPPQTEYRRTPQEEKLPQVDYNRTIPPETEYRRNTQEEKLPQVDYNRTISPQREYRRTPHEEKHTQVDYNDSTPLQQPVTSINTTAVSQAGVTLTPELIATLASLLPAKDKSSGLVSTQQPLESSLKSSLPPNVASDTVALSQGYDYQAMEQTGHPFQQLGSQFNQEQLLTQLQTYPSVPTIPSHSAQGVGGSLHVQDSSFHMPHQALVSSRNQSGQFAVSPQINQQYQYEIPQNAPKVYGMTYGTGGYGSCISSDHQQQPANPVILPNQVHDSNAANAVASLPVSNVKVDSEIPNQFQQLQYAFSGSDQGTSEMEGDKNQRYQSTLQFAANLLHQIHQQQQTGAQTAQGQGNRQ